MDLLAEIGKTVERHFKNSRRVLSYSEYLDLVRAHPGVHLRSAAEYLRDMIDSFGSDRLKEPTGEVRRHHMFDAPWDQGVGRLAGQEEVQEAIYRVVDNFVRKGRVDRFILLHGPNGSAKSTITDMFSRGMESYSARDEGALYRFNWVFPAAKISRAGIGFGQQEEDASRLAMESFAHLDESEVDARLPCEMHDHPLLLVPSSSRSQLLEQLREGIPGTPPQGAALSLYLQAGDLCPKCKKLYEALLSSYEGDYLRVLRHVQVERFYVSRRYRVASSRVEPQLAVDARTRQVTADRSLGSLPSALLSINLYELEGDLVQANRGVADFTDLLKRPMEAYKYLLIAVEEGRVVLDQANLFFDLVFLGSSNDAHLHGLMESAEWTSFKGRFELVRVPYLLQYPKEQCIYDEQIHQRQVGKHIAPHATSVAALWAVLTRMYRPDPERYPEKLRPMIRRLTPMQKAELYATGAMPDWARGEEAKQLRASLEVIHRETESSPVYEGRFGASPREIKTVILNAAQRRDHGCLSPAAVIKELRALVQETSVYAYLRMEAKEGYYDPKGFIDQVRSWYLDRTENELRGASGLVEEASTFELFTRYLNNVMHQIRKEKLQNPMTGAYEDPDERLMVEVEKELGITGKVEDHRRGLISKIGAWSVDHAGEKPAYREIFPEQLEKLRASYYGKQRKRLSRILQQVTRVLNEDTAALSAEDLARARGVLARLEEQYGYCPHCARELVTTLARERYTD